jgi:hypothetical protein
MGLRVQAALALSCIGEPARKAAPQLLAMVVRGNPDDPRRIEAKYLGYSLFRDGFIDQMPVANGLVAASVAGVDHLIEADCLLGHDQPLAGNRPRRGT